MNSEPANTSNGELDVADIYEDADIPGPTDNEICPVEEDSGNQARHDNDTTDIYAKQRADDEHQKNLEHLESLKQDRTQRKEFAGKIYGLICLWLIGVAIFLLLRAWNAWGFYLSDAIMIALITTTSANVIGLLAIVILYLFPRKQK